MYPKYTRLTAKATRVAIFAIFMVSSEPVNPNTFCCACLIFCWALYNAIPENSKPIPPKQALIKLIKQRTKIGVLAKRVFIDKGFVPALNATPFNEG